MNEAMSYEEERMFYLAFVRDSEPYAVIAGDQLTRENATANALTIRLLLVNPLNTTMLVKRITFTLLNWTDTNGHLYPLLRQDIYPSSVRVAERSDFYLNVTWKISSSLTLGYVRVDVEWNSTHYVETVRISSQPSLIANPTNASDQRKSLSMEGSWNSVCSRVCASPPSRNLSRSNGAGDIA